MKFFSQLNDETIKKISFLREKYTSDNPVWQNPVRAFIDSLIALDQKKHMAIVGEQKCADVWKSNHDLLFEYIKENGFPDERVIGVDSTSMALPFGYVLYRHFAQTNLLSSEDLNAIKRQYINEK